MNHFKILILLVFAGSISNAQTIGAGFSWLSSDNFYLDKARSIRVFGSVPVFDRLEFSLSYGYTYNAKSFQGTTSSDPFFGPGFFERIDTKLKAHTYEMSFLFDILVFKPLSLSLGVAGNISSLKLDARGSDTGNIVPQNNARKSGYGVILAIRSRSFPFPFIDIGFSLQSTSLRGESAYSSEAAIPFNGCIAIKTARVDVAYSF